MVVTAKMMKSYTMTTCESTDSVTEGLAQRPNQRHDGAVTRSTPPARNSRSAPETRLDDVAKRIIELLQEDGRQSYAAIAKAVGLSEAAVRQRVQRLLDAERHADRRGDRPAPGGLLAARR